MRRMQMKRTTMKTAIGNGDETDEKVVDVAKVQREKMEKLRMILDGKSMTV